ncbi:HAMP domain-containing histidine kinase [Desulfovibrio sp. OttesenSCG-928-I05]|nr:HAMP domain-containing histidine kinase [Desulfovibrio sp. OttesenSCG-928-I05]
MHQMPPGMSEELVFDKTLSSRIHEKIADYERYRFTPRQSWAMNIFFDLSQEFEDLRFLYHLPGEVLRVFFDIDSEFHTYNKEKGTFELRTRPVGPTRVLPPVEAVLAGPVQGEGCWHFPVRGRTVFGDSRPSGDMGGTDEAPGANTAPSSAEGEETHQTNRSGLIVLGIVTIYCPTPLTKHALLYYEKFTNRFGFCLHNRLLAEKNSEHIRFVRSLVHDIGHNVIVPNMYFKLLLKQLDGKIDALGKLCGEMTETPSAASLQALHHLHGRIEEQYQEITRHFQQSSFFLETLLRQSHFDQGTYVLHKNSLDLIKRVVEPQVERYRGRFEEKGIIVQEVYPDPAPGPLMVEADRGLLSQVLANLLSNATKYTRETPGISGLFMRCSVERIADYFGTGKDGARVSVLTSGPAVAEGEQDKLFDEHFRASNTGDEYGTGHGLHFTLLIMHQHKGEAGYTRTPEGNVFHVTLPCLDDVAK